MRPRESLLVAGFAVVAVLAGGCDDRQGTIEPEPAEDPAEAAGNEVPTEASAAPSPYGGSSPVALWPHGGLPSHGPQPVGPGPWPVDPVLDYSQAFSLGAPQSVALDEGLNLWLLDGDQIGVLRPGELAPRWTAGIGQARQGFGVELPATGSTVICGGIAGRAYVGYRARELQPVIFGRPHAFVPWPGEPHFTPERYAEYQKGDLDAVVLNADGTVSLEEHLWRTIGRSNKDKEVGIHNTNDFGR